MARFNNLGLVVLVVLCAAGTSALGKSKPAEKTFDPQTFVDAHNAVRAGVPQPAGYVGVWTPIGPIAWSDEIALTSQEWANSLRENNKCNLVHSDTRYGENLAGGKDMDPKQAVKMWASEGARFTYKPKYEWDVPTGHYSQVIWRKSTQVGCGWASCGKKVVIVCRYNPPGNHIDKAPY